MIMNRQELRQVTVVMVTHHSAHCLALQNDLLAHCPNIIISDNASNDGTPEQAKALWPHATVLAHPNNLGFGAANNRALALVTTPFAFLLNPDCAITADALLALMSAAQNMPEAALIAPQFLGAKGKRELNYRWPRTQWDAKGVGAEGPTCVGFVCGAAMFLRIAHFSQIGFFDETFFLYYEDDDLCLRLFNAKRPMVLVPDILAIHISRGSVKGKVPLKSEYARGYHHAQSKLFFENKHGSLSGALQKRRRLIISTTVALFFRVLLLSPKRLARMWGRWQGLWAWEPAHGH